MTESRWTSWQGRNPPEGVVEAVRNSITKVTGEKLLVKAAPDLVKAELGQLDPLKGQQQKRRRQRATAHSDITIKPWARGSVSSGAKSSETEAGAFQDCKRSARAAGSIKPLNIINGARRQVSRLRRDNATRKRLRGTEPSLDSQSQRLWLP